MPKDAPEGSELEALFPTPTVVPINGEAIAVRTLTIAEWAPLAAELKPFFESAQIHGNWLSGVLTDVTCIVGAVALATDRSREWIGALPPKQFRKLATAFMERNADFFGLALGFADSVNTATRAARSDGDGAANAPT